MSRKNIYQIIAEQKIDPTDAFESLKYYLFNKEYPSVNYRRITPYVFIENYAFSHMPIRQTFTGFMDLVNGSGINHFRDRYVRDFDEVFILSEIILCAIDHSPRKCFGIGNIVPNDFYYDIYYVINSIVSNCGHKIVEMPYGRIIVTEDAVRDQAIWLSQDEEMSLALLEYTHYANSGNIEAKASILTKLGKIIEPRLENAPSTSTADIVKYLLNSFHLRHNNQSGKWSKEYIKDMNDTEREEWLDKLYNSIVHLIIEDEQKAINSEVVEFRKNNH